MQCKGIPIQIFALIEKELMNQLTDSPGEYGMLSDLQSFAQNAHQ